MFHFSLIFGEWRLSNFALKVPLEAHKVSLEGRLAMRYTSNLFLMYLASTVSLVAYKFTLYWGRRLHLTDLKSHA